jgi:hypothetical protein
MLRRQSHLLCTEFLCTTSRPLSACTSRVGSSEAGALPCTNSVSGTCPDPIRVQSVHGPAAWKSNNRLAGLQISPAWALELQLLPVAGISPLPFLGLYRKISHYSFLPHAFCFVMNSHPANTILWRCRTWIPGEVRILCANIMVNIQAVSHRLPTAAAQVRFQSKTCGICGE